MLLFFYQGATAQSIKQTVQTALDNNESLKSQKKLVDNSYQNFLIQSGKLLPNLSLNLTGNRSSNFDTNQETDGYSISVNSSYTLFDFGSLNAKKRSAQQLNDAAQVSTGVTKDLIRLSVGLENIDDLKADLEAAFSAVSAQVPCDS